MNHGISIFFNLYIDVQCTGSQGQFYQKYQFRFYLSKILSYLLKNKEIFWKQFLKMFCTEHTVFEKYNAFICTDLEYLIDQVIEILNNIRSLEQPQQPQQAVEHLNREHLIQQHQSRVLNCNKIFNSFLKLLEITVSIDPRLYLRSQVIQKFIDCLNYILKVLVIKNGLQIKVNQMDKIKFKPVKIFTRLMNIFMSMHQFKHFKYEIVRDERSYSTELFQNVFDIVFCRKIIPNFFQYEPLKDFFNQVRGIEEELKAQMVITLQDYCKFVQDIYEDAPDQYRDAILLQLMDNPVLLPSSGAVVDFMTIKRLIINSEQDPFDRSVLTLDMVKQLPQLKEKICQYKESKKIKKSE